MTGLEYKLLGTASIVIFWLMAIILVAWWRGDTTQPLSKHAAAHKQAYLMFAVITAACLIAYGVFLVGWFIPALQLSSLATAVLLISTACLVLTVVIPDRGVWPHRLHSTLALMGTILMLFIPIILYTAPVTTGFTSTVAVIGFVLMVLSAVAFFAGKQSRWRLIGEVGYFIAFHTMMLTIAWAL